MNTFLIRCANPRCDERPTRTVIGLCPSCWLAMRWGMETGVGLAAIVGSLLALAVRFWCW